MAHLRGVSADFLTFFGSKLRGSEHLSTQQICDKIIRPETLTRKCAYVELCEGQTDSHGRPYVSKATVFVSHAWKYNFVSVALDVMLAYAADNPDTYFWFDLFVNNQHGTSAVPYEWWTNRFRQSIQEIGAVVLILSPWNDPIPITRAWCLFEIMASLQSKTDGVELRIMLPMSERNALKKGIEENFESILNALVEIRAQRAICFKEEDRVNIMRAIEDTVGFDAMNAEVKDVLREWYIATGKDIADSLLAADEEPGVSKAGFLLNLGASLRAFGHIEQALRYLEQAVDIFLRTVGPNHLVLAKAYNNIGEAHRSLRRFELAISFNRKALQIQEASADPCPVDIAGSLNNLGIICQSQRQHTLALEYHTKALEIRLGALGPADAEVADTYNNIAHSLNFQGKYGTGLICYLKALQIRLSAQNPHHPDIATACNNIAVVCAARAEEVLALDLFGRALAIRLDTLGPSHPEVASVYRNMSTVLLVLNDQSKALEYASKAQSIFDCLKKHPDHGSQVAEKKATTQDESYQLDEALSSQHISSPVDGTTGVQPGQNQTATYADADGCDDDVDLVGRRCSISSNMESDDEAERVVVAKAALKSALVGRNTSICMRLRVSKRNYTSAAAGSAAPAHAADVQPAGEAPKYEVLSCGPLLPGAADRDFPPALFAVIGSEMDAERERRFALQAINRVKELLPTIPGGPSSLLEQPGATISDSGPQSHIEEARLETSHLAQSGADSKAASIEAAGFEPRRSPQKYHFRKCTLI